ncbi:uncharacterized protein LOC125044953 [Penaeus chinensis]|uniref:uncharacterized protein LOC125044953 n=1 Tax=Penaeus chinensis TaxID=139456 RepID=UPI001FB65507|nr:uncharacterized protein LOC125044953 [Penaeus chinensis]XP_047497882.1 uncharacterized protein LOC125044953 [Penaeus chinensis]
MSAAPDAGGRGHIAFDQSHVNIKLPNRCRRCHAYNEDPDVPMLRESYVILLNQMTRTPQGLFFLLGLSFPQFAVTSVALLVLLVYSHYNIVLVLIHCLVLLNLARFCVVKYFGRRYAREYSAEADLLHLHAAALRHSNRGGLATTQRPQVYENATLPD